MQDWSKIEQKISESLGKDFYLEKQVEIGGGDINQAYQIDGILNKSEAVSFFIKFNQKNRLDMFEAEAAGLQEIEKAQAIAVPHVISCGVDGAQSYLILEKVSFTAGNTDSAKQLGQQLATMHKYTSSNYGWFQDNTIGSTCQKNSQTDNWINFWREQRLSYQLKLAKQKGAGASLIQKGESLSKKLDALFIGYEPEASLVHGDLWSGNYGYLESGAPIIYDPAVYYGDRETDIAMTELFGGFSADFYSSYNQAWQLDSGYQQRKTLYNLYHVLNHYNLFGGGYAMQAENMLNKLLAYI